MRRKEDDFSELDIYFNKNINTDFVFYNRVKDIPKEASKSEKREAEDELLKTRMGIANRIIEIRKKAGVKQRELAALLGICGSKLSCYETGKNDYPVEVLFEIAQIFESVPGVSLDYIILGKSPVVIDKEIADILKGKSFKEKEQAAKLLKVHFGME